MKLNREIAEFLGALSGDGLIGIYGDRSNQFMIQFAGHAVDDKKYMQHLAKLLEEFEVAAIPKYRVKNNTIWMYVYSKKLLHILNKDYKFPIGKKGDRLVILDEIVQSEALIRRFIRGVFDTDGCVFLDKRKTYKKPYPRIRLEIVSQKLFKEIANYLHHYFKTYQRERNRPRHQKTYILEIYGHKNLEKWMDLIGFSNEKHLKKVYASVA